MQTVCRVFFSCTKCTTRDRLEGASPPPVWIGAVVVQTVFQRRGDHRRNRGQPTRCFLRIYSDNDISRDSPVTR
jgi:hypothetical protein